MSYSQPVGIELKLKSGDVATGGTVSSEKEINTESGNPYGAFITAANTALGGKPPGRIEVSSLTLLVGGASKNATTLQQVLTGEVDVLFVMNNSNDTYNVGKTTGPMGGGPVSMNVTWDSSAVAALDMTQLLSGSFKVVLRGTAATGFSGLQAEAVLQVTFIFQAFE